MGAIETLVVWENLDITRYVLKNSSSRETVVTHLNKEQETDQSNFRDPDTNAELEVQDKLSLLEWFANEYRRFAVHRALSRTTHFGLVRQKTRSKSDLDWAQIRSKTEVKWPWASRIGPAASRAATQHGRRRGATHSNILSTFDNIEHFAFSIYKDIGTPTHGGCFA
ncbi:hypothetical protein RND71_036335 [Anisodus tanguticus]|uniref:Uncharacterized protein n=1 Tax=Anisodus tanguticus TaxID=243964 RepID=A0AAE1UXQ2_9SOLA|nr:hypothetical protein RND71_036335 [Anisodus tanguticus]